MSGRYDDLSRHMGSNYGRFGVDKTEIDVNNAIEERVARIKKSLQEKQAKKEHEDSELMRVTSELKAVSLKLQSDIEDVELSYEQVLDLIYAIVDNTSDLTTPVEHDKNLYA